MHDKDAYIIISQTLVCVYCFLRLRGGGGRLVQDLRLFSESAHVIPNITDRLGVKS